MARASSKSRKNVTRAKKTSTKKKKTGTSTGTGLKDPEAVCDAVFKFMCEEYSFGMTEWTRAELASEVGFGSAKTEKFTKGIAILVKEKKLAENGSGKASLVLSELGISKIPPETKSKTLEEVHNRFQEHLKKKAASSAGKVPKIWAILADRKSHDIKDIAKELGYGNPNSLKNTKILQMMETMALVVKDEKSYKMTDKAFPSELTREETVEM